MKSVILIAVMLGVVQGSCPNSCSGHGSCNNYDQCTCYTEENVGVNFFTEADWTGADCSLRKCARGISWTQRTGGTDKCNHKLEQECSDQGVCDRSTGLCTCFPGYEGSSCQRTKCPNACSGHGTCRSNQDFAYDFSLAKAGELGSKSGEYLATYLASYNKAWDSGLQYGCKCDIGYRGPDCSLIECPSTQDPLDDKCRAGITKGEASPAVGTNDIVNFQLQFDVATGNSGWDAAYAGGAIGSGPNVMRQGNKVYSCYGAMSGQDCSGRGLCDYTTGACKCFKGYGGTACELVSEIS